MKIQIAVCDDDEIIAKKIESSLMKYIACSNIDVESKYFSNVKSLLSEVFNNKFDVILLDIEMPDMNGFEVACSIAKSGISSKIVFITSHDELVYDSFDYEPFYFIRKINYDKNCKRLADRLVEELNNHTVYILQSQEQVVSLSSDDIVFVNSDDHYVFFHTIHGDYSERKRISEVESELAGAGFVRVHKKYIVNLNFVVKIDYLKTTVTMSNGVELRIGRTYINKFKKSFLDYRRKM